MRYQVFEIMAGGTRIKLGVRASYEAARELAAEKICFAAAAGGHIAIFQGNRHVLDVRR